ncbi:hypothetical protein P4644_27610, partial [Priestia aryabhattai]|nr:hypothetical protein [Priestia aryabhattai]
SGYSAKKLWEQWFNATGEYGGGVDIKKVHHIDNVGAYIIKYLEKDLKKVDERLLGKKVYQTSQGLDKPKEFGLSFRKEKDQQIYNDLLKGKKITYQSRYEDKHTGGTVDYLEINLARQA